MPLLVTFFLIRTLPGALNRLILLWLCRFVLLRTLHGVYRATGSSVKLDALDKMNVAAFHIIGLTKIPQIEFLLLDWIYRSIRIMTVSSSLYSN